MKYPVIRKFRDKYTGVAYKIGDTYETEDAKRAEYLQGKDALGEPLDKPTQPESKHIGGGWYELPDGARVKGREAAESALKEAGDGGDDG